MKAVSYTPLLKAGLAMQLRTCGMLVTTPFTTNLQGGARGSRCQVAGVESLLVRVSGSTEFQPRFL